MLPMFWEWKYIEYVLNIFYGKQQTCRVPLIKGNDTLRNFTTALMRKNGRIIVTHNYFGTLFVRPELSHAIESVAILISMVLTLAGIVIKSKENTGKIVGII